MVSDHLLIFHSFFFLVSRAKTYIPSNHECIQILHHAFVYNIKLVLLLIGNKKGTILRGVWVIFHDEIMMAYDHFLSRCHDLCLKWAYDGLDESSIPNEDEDIDFNFIKKLLPPGVDFEGFLDF